VADVDIFSDCTTCGHSRRNHRHVYRKNPRRLDEILTCYQDDCGCKRYVSQFDLSDRALVVTYSKVEYGLIRDRTVDGLGYQLASVTDDLAAAQKQAQRLTESVPRWPVTVKARTATYTEWAELPAASVLGGEQ
jgi:hypothetical protein